MKTRCHADLRRRSRFTLVEVVAALAILGMALAGYFAISQSAARRAERAYERWHRMHLLSLAAEYYLLFPSEEPPDIPADILDDPDYRVEASYGDAENLPDDFRSLDNLAPLRTLILDLVRKSDNQVVDTLKIDRIDFDGESGS